MMIPQAIVRNLAGRPRIRAPKAQERPDTGSAKTRKGNGRHGGAVAAGIWAALLLILVPAVGAAHGPKEVVLTYNQGNRVLEVRVTHGVSDPSKHYVSGVEIRKGGKTVLNTEYRNQPAPETFVYTYPLDPAPDDVIEVKATCNVFGSRTEKLDMRKIPR